MALQDCGVMTDPYQRPQYGPPHAWQPPAPPPPPKRKSRAPLIVAVSVMAVLVLCIGVVTIYGLTQGSKPKDPATADLSGDAFVICQSFVRKQLKAPSTAKFPAAESTKKDGATYTVAGGVDAQNSYGAMVRTPYTCVVHADGNDKWSLVDLKMEKI